MFQLRNLNQWTQLVARAVFALLGCWILTHLLGRSPKEIPLFFGAAVLISCWWNDPLK